MKIREFDFCVHEFIQRNNLEETLPFPTKREFNGDGKCVRAHENRTRAFLIEHMKQRLVSYFFVSIQKVLQLFINKHDS